MEGGPSGPRRTSQSGRLSREAPRGRGRPPRGPETSGATHLNADSTFTVSPQLPIRKSEAEAPRTLAALTRVFRMRIEPEFLDSIAHKVLEEFGAPGLGVALVVDGSLGSPADRVA